MKGRTSPLMAGVSGQACGGHSGCRAGVIWHGHCHLPSRGPDQWEFSPSGGLLWEFRVPRAQLTPRAKALTQSPLSGSIWNALALQADAKRVLRSPQDGIFLLTGILSESFRVFPGLQDFLPNANMHHFPETSSNWVVDLSFLSH